MSYWSSERLSVYAINRAGERYQISACVPGHALYAEINREPSSVVAGKLLSARRSFPWAPLIVNLTTENVQDWASCAEFGHEVGARAVITSSTFNRWPDVMRRICSVARLPAEFATWLRVLRPDMPSRWIERAQVLVKSGKEGDRRVAAIAHKCGITARALQRGFARWQLPPPDRFGRFGQLVRGVCARSLDPRMGLSEAAFLSGYSDAASYHRALEPFTAANPSESPPLSWEWLAWRMELYRLRNSSHRRRT